MGVVLDSSVILKALLPPPKNLKKEVYQREVETHKKCQRILEIVEDKDIEIHVPAVVTVEVAGVIKRITGDKSRASLVSETIAETFRLHYDAELLEKATEIAALTGASGFDAYFIATAYLLDIPLLTDDKGMHLRAQELGINSTLIRETLLEKIEEILR
ncbi:Hypothetical nucleic acid-binding protein [Thermococcus onnurineus NA1]|uniref:Ribonuclease VapC n=1 Tax=Thermococcus onnurineus (strain NA1) TaxID=523850 RepID=B6YTT7_THEON|nr:type II toxin-antitoxin system VapC family toxin [Thermococcus onnurineus]ACJ17028.1 Hypothetical nucleic acid-binding protein [Thermococcus onnurineus NA1]